VRDASLYMISPSTCIHVRAGGRFEKRTSTNCMLPSSLSTFLAECWREGSGPTFNSHCLTYASPLHKTVFTPLSEDDAPSRIRSGVCTFLCLNFLSRCPGTMGFFPSAAALYRYEGAGVYGGDGKGSILHCMDLRWGISWTGKIWLIICYRHVLGKVVDHDLGTD
jgi:hypothetical protein